MPLPGVLLPLPSLQLPLPLPPLLPYHVCLPAALLPLLLLLPAPRTLLGWQSRRRQA